MILSARTLPVPLVVLLFAALLLSACSGSRPLTPEERATGFVFAAFTLRPPAGEDWVLVGRKEEAVVFGRRPSETHSVLAVGSVNRAARPIAGQAELVQLMEAKWAVEMRDNRRHRNKTAHAEPIARFGGRCVRYALRSDDHGAVNKGGADFLRQQAAGLVCSDPRDPTRVVHVGYSERALPSELDPRFEQHAQAFLDGFQLNGAP